MGGVHQPAEGTSVQLLTVPASLTNDKGFNLQFPDHLRGQTNNLSEYRLFGFLFQTEGL